MDIFIEGYAYSKASIEKAFGDLRFCSFINGRNYIDHVGYYFSKVEKKLVYILPKVLIKDGKLFGTVDFCSNLKEAEVIQLDQEFNEGFLDVRETIKKFLPFFQSSLFRYKKERLGNGDIDISIDAEIQDLLVSNGSHEISILEIIHKIELFSKKNPNIKHFFSEYQSNRSSKKANWLKTISKKKPDFFVKGSPIYSKTINRNKSEDLKFELINIYMGILNYISSFYFHKLNNIRYFGSITIVKLEKNSDVLLRKVRRLRKTVFTDQLREMSFLCELFLNDLAKNDSTKSVTDLVLVKNYNIVFESMVDNIFSNALPHSKNIQSLKNNKDGKIIDHIFGHQSLLNEKSVFYIGDSKYYKEKNSIESNSVYKQFTYAKNIVQFNIDYLNNNQALYLGEFWYRDRITEGYNPTPNFFIRGSYENYKDFDNLNLRRVGHVKSQYHFEDRFFDRDSFRVLTYSFSFLRVLCIYALRSRFTAGKVGRKISDKIRSDFISHLNNDDMFIFYFIQIERNEIENLIERNFRLLNGKVISFDNTLLLAKHRDDNSLDDFLNSNGFQRFIFE